MEASNDAIPKGMDGLHSEFNDTYGAVQNALALKLAMDLARIFDLSDSKMHSAHKQDKASVQVLAALLQLDGMRASLEDDAAKWFPGIADLATVGNRPLGVVEAALKDAEDEHRSQDRAACQKAISDFLALAERLGVDGSEEKAALGRLRDFRTRRLAHSLFDKAPDEFPRYSDLNLLLGMAIEAATFASMAVEGLDTGLDDQARRYRENAEGYAACVLDGLKRTAMRSVHE